MTTERPLDLILEKRRSIYACLSICLSLSVLLPLLYEVYTFLAQELIANDRLTHIVVVVLLVVGRPLQKARGSVVSNRIGVKFGRIVV